MLKLDDTHQNQQGYEAGLRDRQNGLKPEYRWRNRQQWQTRTEQYRAGYRDGYSDRIPD